MLSIWFEQLPATASNKNYLGWKNYACLNLLQNILKEFKKRDREKKKKSKHNLIILITEAAKAFKTSWCAGLCAFTPCNVPSEILLATYHTSKYWQSFRAQGNHLLLHQILPDSCSRDHSSLNHSITTSRWFSYIQLYINLIFPVTEKTSRNNCKGHNLCLCYFIGTISYIN